MTERQRFEKIAWRHYLNLCELEKWDTEKKERLFEVRDDEYCRDYIQDYWKLWQARAEIAKQDEKELIETLIRICKITIKLQKELPPNTKWWSLVNENVDLIDIIEKHTSKTWEELNG